MDVNYIKDLIKEILDKTFTDSKRREIHEYEDRLNFCCPVCLDSTKTAHKKRGNVYFDRLMFICYRCSLKCNLNTLCKQYNIRVDLDKKLEMMEHVKDSYSKSKCSADMNDVDLSLLIDLSKLEEVLNINPKEETVTTPSKESTPAPVINLQEKLEEFFIDSFYYDLIWIEHTTQLFSMPWIETFEQQLLAYKLDTMIPIIIIEKI